MPEKQTNAILSAIPNWHVSIDTLIERGLRILIIVAVVVGCAKLIHLVCMQILKSARREKKNAAHASEREKRLATVVKLVDTSLSVMLYGAAILMVLRELGLDITPLLTGAGIAGVAVGFGAQSLVKDVIAGFFILIEDQVRVGDVVKLNNGLSGSVERMELRVTAIRDGDGTLHIVPNGEIKSVSNMTYDFSQAVMKLPVPYDTDLKHICDVIAKVAEEFDRDPAWKARLIGKPEFLGVTGFELDRMMLEINVKTEPHARWAVARELRRRTKLALDAAGISLGRPDSTSPDRK